MKAFVTTKADTTVSAHTANLKFDIKPNTKKIQEDFYSKHKITSTVMYFHILKDSDVMDMLDMDVVSNFHILLNSNLMEFLIKLNVSQIMTVAVRF